MKNEKAIALAKDVLRRLRFLRKVQAGSYCYTYQYLPGLQNRTNMQAHLPFLEKECEVCAMGAMFLSFIRLHDKIRGDKFDNGFKSDVIFGKLGEVFSYGQLNLIESAFEGWHSYKDDATFKFYKQYTDDKKRLRAIMLNIIKNEGEFIL